MNRIPYLDGLRGIAIILVFIGHAKNTVPFISGIWRTILGNSHLGVMIFFVLSGYLITRLLIHEHAKTNTINIRKFYLRRALRIFPIYYLYLLIIAICVYGFKIIELPFDYLWTTALYLANYRQFFTSASVSIDYKFIGHFWTLSLEEQYYMVWPSVLLLFGFEKTKRFLPFVLAAYPLLRLASYFLFPSSRGQIGMMLHTMGDSILWGCYAALLEKFHPKLIEDFISKMQKFKPAPFLILFSLFIIIPLITTKLGGNFLMTVGMCLEGALTAIFLLYILNAKPASFEFLNNRTLSFIGVLSYSIYIWHMLILRNNHFTSNFPLNLILTLSAAYISYTFIEKPIMNLKDRFKAY